MSTRRRQSAGQRSSSTVQRATLALLLVAATSLPATPAVQAQRDIGNFPAFPYLLHRKEPYRGKWHALGQQIWEALKQLDFDFMDSQGNVVPPGLPGSRPVTGVACGRIARLWIRMPFHDCGTYNINKQTGGCNGSLRKEIPETMPLQDVKTGKVIFQDVFDQLGKDKARADYAFDKRRKENTGFAISTSFFYQMKFKAEKELGLTASWADIMIYSGMLSVFMCEGPAIRFVPGRIDSTIADARGLLPAASDSLDSILGAFRRAGLGSLDAVTNLASHTTACFTAGCLDTTPYTFDNRWAWELMNTFTPQKLCHLPGIFPADAVQHCYAPMDVQLLNSRDTYNQLYLLSQNIPDAAQLAGAVAQFGGLDGYASGVLWGVNLCGPGDCDRSQWSFHHLFASSYYRLTSLGLPRNWPGYQPSYTGASSARSGVLPASVVVSVEASAVRGTEETQEQQEAREAAWNATYKYS